MSNFPDPHALLDEHGRPIQISTEDGLDPLVWDKLHLHVKNLIAPMQTENDILKSRIVTLERYKFWISIVAFILTTILAIIIFFEVGLNNSPVTIYLFR